ncbi:hypothetical protein HY489_03260 [Candidatus Woesearchaeota archaeon]|nr:hypothetical protein [Candidatus Woesearchaeota archaeon]
MPAEVRRALAEVLAFKDQFGVADEEWIKAAMLTARQWLSSPPMNLP